MGKKMVRFGTRRDTRSRQDESIEVGEVGSKRPSLGGNGDTRTRTRKRPRPQQASGESSTMQLRAQQYEGGEAPPHRPPRLSSSLSSSSQHLMAMHWAAQELEA
jgi:hypothetical protein